MRHLAIVVVAMFGLPACSSTSGSGGGATGNPDAAGAGADAETDATSSGDATSGSDSAAPPQDSAIQETSTHDSGGEVADASDGGEPTCPASWFAAPAVGAPIEVPLDGGGTVLLHAEGTGTQNYTCTASDAGTVWTLTGPTAALSDCNGVVVGHHFASEAGAGYPEWETTDGTYVVGHKLAAFTPDGGGGSVPWLLLQSVSNGGAGTLSATAYVQRLYTDGGVAPGAGCDAGDTVQIPYGAQYYFYGP